MTEKDKYEHLIGEFFPVISDPLPEFPNDITLVLESDLLDNIIRNLPNKKANGYDKISNKIIKCIHGFESSF